MYWTRSMRSLCLWKWRHRQSNRLDRLRSRPGDLHRFTSFVCNHRNFAIALKCPGSTTQTGNRKSVRLDIVLTSIILNGFLSIPRVKSAMPNYANSHTRNDTHPFIHDLCLSVNFPYSRFSIVERVSRLDSSNQCDSYGNSLSFREFLVIWFVFSTNLLYDWTDRRNLFGFLYDYFTHWLHIGVRGLRRARER